MVINPRTVSKAKLERGIRDFHTLCLRTHKRMRNVHTQIWPFTLATCPETKATTWVLQLGKALDVGIEGCIHSRIRWHIWRIESHQNIAE